MMNWLSIYMQVHSGTIDPGINYMYTQFNGCGLDFVRAARLLDLCSVDVEAGNFDYSILAAASISHILGDDVAMKVSGLVWGKISACANWLKPYYLLLDEDVTMSSYTIQTHR
jgi:hypothetical protein